jgi:hypothetical protein
MHCHSFTPENKAIRREERERERERELKEIIRYRVIFNMRIRVRSCERVKKAEGIEFGDETVTSVVRKRNARSSTA